MAQVVLQMAATGGGWPAAVRERLMMALRAPCEATLLGGGSGGWAV